MKLWYGGPVDVIGGHFTVTGFVLPEKPLRIGDYTITVDLNPQVRQPKLHAYPVVTYTH
jgi:hypothetical protein